MHEYRIDVERLSELLRRNPNPARFAQQIKQMTYRRRKKAVDSTESRYWTKRRRRHPFQRLASEDNEQRADTDRDDDFRACPVPNRS